MLKKALALSAISCAILASNVASANESDSDWEFAIEPYLQGSSIYGNAGIGRADDLPVDVGFDDILEKLDSALMLHFEALNTANNWGVMLDYGYMDLREEASTPNDGLANVRTRQGVFEAMAFKRFIYGNHTVDYFGGIRWWDNDISASIEVEGLPAGVGIEHDEDWVDAVIGARWWYSFAQDWRYHMRADIGGFGAESDFTSAVFAGFEWKATDTLDVNIGYKAMWVDYENSSTISQPGYFKYDTVTKGPVIGASFKF